MLKESLYSKVKLYVVKFIFLIEGIVIDGVPGKIISGGKPGARGGPYIGGIPGIIVGGGVGCIDGIHKGKLFAVSRLKRTTDNSYKCGYVRIDVLLIS